MATNLLKLRNVPTDELEEIHALMEEHEIEVYETSGGNWGISMHALWLKNDEQLEQAKALLKTYEVERFERVRGEYESLKESGKARTFLDIAKENPARYVVYMLIIAGLLYLTLVPFLTLF